MISPTRNRSHASSTTFCFSGVWTLTNSSGLGNAYPDAATSVCEGSALTANKPAFQERIMGGRYACSAISKLVGNVHGFDACWPRHPRLGTASEKAV